jgi:hypothetical protein
MIVCYKGNTRSNIAEDALRAEVSQYLQMENLSFLIGAGCSSNVVDGRETGIPGMAALYKLFFEQCPNFSIAETKVNGMFESNLEKMLEVMGAIHVSNQVKEIDSAIEDKMASVRLFLRKQIASGLDSVEVKEIYKTFYSKITQRTRKTPVSVFTTNYDLFSEIALDELGFQYNNGFSGTYKRKFNPLSYGYTYVENMNLNKNVWERVPSFFNLVKLHGSISWTRRNGEIWERDYADIADEDTVMIYPTPLKDRATLMTPYSDLFRAMENRIVQKNSVLIVLGYSFSDDHINRVILNGLSIPSFRLVVFGNGENIQKLVKLGDSRITVIYSEDQDEKIHYFKNFVSKALPDIHPDIVENMQLQPASEMIKQFETEDSNEQS